MVDKKTTKKGAVKASGKNPASAKKPVNASADPVEKRADTVIARHLFSSEVKEVPADKIPRGCVVVPDSGEHKPTYEELDAAAACRLARMSRGSDSDGCREFSAIKKMYDDYFGIAQIFGGIIADSPRVQDERKNVFNLVSIASFMDIENCALICGEMNKLKDDLKNNPDNLERFIVLFIAMSQKIEQIAGRLENIALTVVSDEAID